MSECTCGMGDSYGSWHKTTCPKYMSTDDIVKGIKERRHSTKINLNTRTKEEIMREEKGWHGANPRSQGGDLPG